MSSATVTATHNQNIQKTLLNFYLVIVDKFSHMWYTVNMNMQIVGKDLIISEVRDFNLRHIFDCGQCFRWNEINENTYLGVAKGKVLKITQNSDTVRLFNTTKDDFDNIWHQYFDLDRNYGDIKKALCNDEIMKSATKYGDGIRILNQDLWETVVSFIISASNNIPRIKGIIERLCALYGNEIEYMDEIYYSFPDYQTLATLTCNDLAPIKAGYRDKYIIDAAKKFADGTLSDAYIRSLSTLEAKKALLTVNGIGEKVANCILLFGLSRTESFPVDVWIKRIMEYCYFDGETSIDNISSLAKEKFGNLGGFAQQYLFFYAREEKIRPEKG